MMGWAIYCDAYNPNSKFWEEFDSISVDNINTSLRACDFATHLYIRWPWSAFETEEGKYAWDHDDYFKQLEKGALERGLKLAFRIYVDSRDYDKSSTPEYVKKAGAKGVYGNTNQWSPYPDNHIFQAKYKKFLSAFAKRYDNNNIVEFIDGFGLGKWGEGHSMILEDSNKYENVFNWITNLYLRSFTKIPIAINYHVEIGEPLLNKAFEKGYILRHDAFGMSQYYSDFEKNIAKAQFPNSPIIAESGWWQNGSIAWLSDPHNYITWRDVWEQTLADALEERANILDLRNISETRSWFQTSYDLVNQFVSEGGYRLYPDKLSLPGSLSNNENIKIIHRWVNLGVGVCRNLSIDHTWKNFGVGVLPNNHPNWNNKYKVAFALLDKRTKAVQTLFIDNESNPNDWLKENATEYGFEIQTKNLKKGEYIWGVAIIDTSNNNESGINISVKGTIISGWVPLFKVTVK